MATRMVKLFVAAVVLVGILLTGGCRGAGPSFSVLTGNYAAGQGRYQKAILRYLRAEDGHGEDVVLYNLANVYYALGEGEAALDGWGRAEGLTADREILFRIHFNRGVLYYQWGRYEESYLSFRQALLLEPGDLDAKINLESALTRIPAATATPVPAPSSEKENLREEDTLRLLEYIKRKEMSEWSPPEETTDAVVDDW